MESSVSWRTPRPVAQGAQQKAQQHVVRGSVVQLPRLETIDNASIVHTLGLREEAFDHPMVVSEIHGGIVVAFPITSFQGTPVIDKFPRDKHRRSKYLLMEHPGQVPHDNTPVLGFVDRTRKMRKPCYVNTAETITIEIHNLGRYGYAGDTREYRLTEEAVETIQGWSEARHTSTWPAPMKATAPSDGRGVWRKRKPGTEPSKRGSAPLAGNAKGVYVPPHQRPRTVSGMVSCPA